MSPCFSRLFPTLSGCRWAEVSLDALARAEFPATTGPNPLNEPDFCDAWVRRVTARLGADHSWGGWLEDRAHLWRGHYLPTGCSIHIGIDFNVPAGTPVLTPAAGQVVHVDASGELGGGWGGWCVIAVRSPRQGADYLLFGHLAHAGLPEVDARLEAGDRLGVVGPPAENGGWYPHLHVQALSAAAWAAVRDDPAELLDGYAHPAEALPELYPDPLPLLTEAAEWAG